MIKTSGKCRQMCLHALGFNWTPLQSADICQITAILAANNFVAVSAKPVIKPLSLCKHSLSLSLFYSHIFSPFLLSVCLPHSAFPVLLCASFLLYNSVCIKVTVLPTVLIKAQLKFLMSPPNFYFLLFYLIHSLFHILLPL